MLVTGSYTATLCATREITAYICYTTTTYELQAFKNKKKMIKRHFSLSFSLLYLLIHSCKFITIEICALLFVTIERDAKVMRSNVYIRVGLKAAVMSQFVIKFAPICNNGCPNL